MNSCRVHKLDIKGYYRVLHHRYTLDLMCWRWYSRSILATRTGPTRGRENICTHFGSIGFSTCGFFPSFFLFFLLKALLPPRSIRFLLRSTFHIECLVSNSFFNAPANSSLAYVRFKPWFYLTPWQFFSIRTPFLTLSCKICREICLLFNPLPYDLFSDHSSVRYSMSCMWNIKILGSLYALDMCLVSWTIIAET